MFTNQSQTIEELEKLCRCSGFVIYREYEGKIQYLLVETYQKKFYFSFPKGRRETGEDLITTAKRELLEETGVTDGAIECDYKTYYVETLKVKNADGVFYNKPHICMFLAKLIDPKFTLAPQDLKEVKSVKWLTDKEISGMVTEFSWQRRSITRQVQLHLEML